MLKSTRFSAPMWREMAQSGNTRRGRCNGSKKVGLIGMPRREHVSTSHVERHNLTIRMQMRLLSGSRTPTARKPRITLTQSPCSSCTTTTAASTRRSRRTRPSRWDCPTTSGRSRNCWGYWIETLPVPILGAELRYLQDGVVQIAMVDVGQTPVRP